MSVTLTGFKGGVNPQTQQSGLDELKQADAAKAKEVLASLSTDLAQKMNFRGFLGNYRYSRLISMVFVAYGYIPTKRQDAQLN